MKVPTTRLLIALTAILHLSCALPVIPPPIPLSTDSTLQIALQNAGVYSHQPQSQSQSHSQSASNRAKSGLIEVQDTGGNVVVVEVDDLTKAMVKEKDGDDGRGEREPHSLIFEESSQSFVSVDERAKAKKVATKEERILATGAPSMGAVKSAHDSELDIKASKQEPYKGADDRKAKSNSKPKSDAGPLKNAHVVISLDRNERKAKGEASHSQQQSGTTEKAKGKLQIIPLSPLPPNNPNPSTADSLHSQDIHTHSESMKHEAEARNRKHKHRGKKETVKMRIKAGDGGPVRKNPHSSRLSKMMGKEGNEISKVQVKMEKEVEKMIKDEKDKKHKHLVSESEHQGPETQHRTTKDQDKDAKEKKKEEASKEAAKHVKEELKEAKQTLKDALSKERKKKDGERDVKKNSDRDGKHGSSKEHLKIDGKKEGHDSKKEEHYMKMKNNKQKIRLLDEPKKIDEEDEGRHFGL